MDIAFEYEILKLYTSSYNGLTDVVKKIQFQITGKKQNSIFSLVHTLELMSDPDTENFKPFNQLSKEDVLSWIENNSVDFENVKSHIKMIIDRDFSLENKIPNWSKEIIK